MGFFEIRADKSAASASSFLKNLVKKAPFKMANGLTDNGKEFTNRFCATGSRRPTGNYLLDHVCAQDNIQYRLMKPNHPETSGMVERFYGRIKEVLSQTWFHTAAQPKEALTHYGGLSHHHIPQKISAS
uniref:DDE-type integrase/transposase/recombinase n=1 Tax=Desulfosoma caldarium TaxID=610254 RepID=UPI0014728E4C|nr:DDE-type integrase/transposase/recombinase [Desulfosoma caldarium]